jgi:hypothetical protein
MSNKTFKLFADKMGGNPAASYIGSAGDLFYDPEIGSIKLSDGTSPGGISINAPTVLNSSDNTWHVNPSRTDTYVATGDFANPFKTITDALAYIEARIADGSLSSFDPTANIVLSPQFIILTCSTTENVALTRGHIYIIGDTPHAGHVPIWIQGNVTITPAAATKAVNDFGLFHVAVLPSGANHGVTITGSNPCRVYLEDTYVYQGTANKSCVYADNTGTATKIELVDCHMSRASGSTHLIDIQRGYCKIESLETNGIGQVLNQANDSTGTMLNSSIDANTGAVVTLSGTAAWGMGNSILNNTSTAANTYGVSMSGTASMQFGMVTFNVPAAQATNRAINGVAGNTVLYTMPVFQYGSTDKISTAITLVALDTAFTAA